MNKINKIDRECIVGGVDTHKDIHVAAVVNELNQVLSTESFPTTRHGYKKMLMWMSSFGRVSRIGIECSGTYGLGLLRYMQSSGIEVLEVTAPDKSDRRKRGKDDSLDAENAAHAAFSKLRTVTPKTRDGMVESLRVLKSCRKSAVSARTVALQMIRTSIVSAPDELRDTLRHMTRMSLIRTLASTRPDLTNYRDISTAYRITLKSLARRYIELHDEIADLDKMIATIVETLAPQLIEQTAVGYESAAQLLITLGDNPERLRSESSFAALCGVSPIPASSGKTNRHRLNRGGDRAANSALHIIAIGRLRIEKRSQEYIKKRVGDGLSKMEALRCLKRYIAREIYYLLKKRNMLINAVQITS
ncbi:IS110 family transposase [Vibrio sp. MA40-2]|uniref:IS110 family transposase n=1 Tax=Vibrio sp. MA40-2 TaxID=3391828 RepID=UPI0039A5937F